jgi:uncharacterized protein YbjT (DUF2867 family)
VTKIVVFGGNGFIGSHLCARFSASGHEVIVPARRIARARHLLPLPTVEIVQTDDHALASETWLDTLLTGVEAVVNLVGVLHSRAGRPFGPGFAHAHVDFPERLAKACARNNVGRFIHISALGADAHGPSEYLRSKAEGERVVQESIGAVDWTILRPSVVFGPGDHFLNTFARLCRLFPVLPLGSTRARFQPAYVSDLTRVIERSLGETAASRQIFEVAGPHIYTLGELVSRAGEIVGRHPLIVSLPDGLAMLQAGVLECLPQPLLSRDNVRSMQRDNIATGAPLPFGLQGSALEVVAPAYLGQDLGRPDYDVFRQQARR